MFSENQLKALSYNLDESRVKSIEKAGMQFKYLETYDVINVANTIFNYMWDYTITSLQEVDRQTNQNGNHAITYSAIVKVRIYDNQRNFIEREDTGVCTATAKTIAEAIDNASKGATSDSLKRSLRSMGSQFGNDLYSKSSIQQQVQPNKQPTSQHQPRYDNSPQNYDSLYKLGLSIAQHRNNLIITGDSDEIFAKKDSIKAFGFRWDGRNKCWYKPLEQTAA